MKKYLFFVLICFYASISFAEKTTYEGSRRCKTCHTGAKNGMVYDKWENTDHAQAFEDLNEEEQKNPFCLKCHTTGYNEEVSPGVTPENLRNVQCEACHGPGSLYKRLEIMDENAFKTNFTAQRSKAIKEGLIVPDEETCKKCHNQESPHYKPFVYRMAYPKIKHLLPRRYLSE